MHPHLTVLEHLTVLALPIPNVPIKPPPGGAEGKIIDVVGVVKWFAGAGIIVCFFAGIAAFTAGRMFDHHRTGRLGLIFIMASAIGALAYAIGPGVLADLAS